VSLTGRERAVLRLRAEGLSDYGIARRLRVDASGVTRSRLNAVRKIERARVDLEFARLVKGKASAK
jgi:DNA-binding NarL/FixJ family response regulator